MAMKTILEFRNVSKSFGGVHAINNLSFKLFDGEILGLIGPNGSGKSTSVNLISGVYVQDQGEILFNDISLKKQSVSSRARLGLARTFQSPKPFLDLSVRDSILTSCLIYESSFSKARKKCDEILDFFNFTSIATESCHRLPIEKRKWLDMARAFAIDPKIIMLDECLAGLTPNEMRDSIELVKSINSTGITILFIEHVMSAVVSLCTRVVVLNEGSFLIEGTPTEVMKHESVIRAYLGEDYKNVDI